MSIPQLLRWQWAGYPHYHRSRTNRVLHIVVVPLFLIADVALIVALFERAWLVAVLAFAAMLVSVAAQGRGHRQEPTPPELQANYPQLAFQEGDASEVALPTGTDLLFSRFGVMFFSQPSQAFSHLRESLREGGRCVFVCWRAPRDNPWAMTPLSAARAALGITPAPADPNAPGPFAFGDEQRVRSILSNAGFEAIDVQRFDAALSIGATPRAAAEVAVQIGPVSRLVREVGAEHLPIILDAVERALVPLAASDGHVSLNGSTGIVSALVPRTAMEALDEATEGFWRF